jgi:hypothetical protein
VLVFEKAKKLGMGKVRTKALMWVSVKVKETVGKSARRLDEKLVKERVLELVVGMELPTEVVTVRQKEEASVRRLGFVLDEVLEECLDLSSHLLRKPGEPKQ